MSRPICRSPSLEMMYIKLTIAGAILITTVVFFSLLNIMYIAIYSIRLHTIERNIIKE